MGGLRTQEGWPSWQESWGRCVLVHSSQQKTAWAEAGQQGPACQADRNPGTRWQLTETNTGAKMGVRQPGRSQAANEACWRVWLADWGQKAGSQGLGEYSRDWSQEQAGHLPQEGSQEYRQPRRQGGLVHRPCCPGWGRVFRGQGKEPVHLVGTRLGAG